MNSFASSLLKFLNATPIHFNTWLLHFKLKLNFSKNEAIEFLSFLVVHVSNHQVRLKLFHIL
ncbi:hypothetical protein CUMW_268430 [Citrus unshiu]|uniref:Uncharacterized protein n=1 Tax=Citrus unshiu TaxID=55188 RepID=A0A2H5QWI2_CITUN|nr:hypothetical protein CUMW_268430 [Citrus unshiu]